MLEGEHARLLVERAYTDIRQGELVDTYARSAFEDTRRKAAKYGAMGSTIRATKPRLIYLDHNATTPIAPEVREAMLPYLEQDFGNPSSTHAYGAAARRHGIEGA